MLMNQLNQQRQRELAALTQQHQAALAAIYPTRPVAGVGGVYTTKPSVVTNTVYTTRPTVASTIYATRPSGVANTIYTTKPASSVTSSVYPTRVTVGANGLTQTSVCAYEEIVLGLFILSIPSFCTNKQTNVNEHGPNAIRYSEWCDPGWNPSYGGQGPNGLYRIQQGQSNWHYLRYQNPFYWWLQYERASCPTFQPGQPS